MLDVENVKTILQAEVNKREKARKKWYKYRSSVDKNKYKEELYERRYYRYCSRFEGMCDMLFDLGCIVWSNDDNHVIVEKRVDEIPF